MMWSYRNPVEVSFGAGMLDTLPTLCGNRLYVLVTYPDPFFKALAVRVTELLGAPLLTVADVSANPDRSVLQRQVQRVGQLPCTPELVLALGGGSVIDTAKVLAAGAYGFSMVDSLLENGEAPPGWQPLPIVAVPTTAGTGSEVTCWATVWNRAAGRKLSLEHPLLYPKAALVDPTLMLGKPCALTISTGLDALSHALESLWNHKVNPLSAAQAVAAAETILAVLPNLVTRLDDLGLRTRMAEAALLAGFAFSNTRTSIAHALSYPITLERGIDHGVACSFTLPIVLASLADVQGLTGQALRRIFGVDLRRGADRLTQFLDGLGVSTNPVDYGISELRWAAMVKEATVGTRGRNFNGDPDRLLTTVIGDCRVVSSGASNEQVREIKAVVFDWAGTTIDFGSFAPMGVFMEAFKAFGIDVTIAEARAPMGAPKRAHIAAMLSMPRLAAQWMRAHGSAVDAAAVDRIYEVFVPMNARVVAEYATLVPGCAEAVRQLRARGLKIGSTTGYTRSIMEQVLPVANQQGYAPDNLVCGDDLPEGRPGPLQMYQCFIDLRIHAPHTVVKVDDTAPGIAEGRAAGCITVGVALSGNHAGLTTEALAVMSSADVDAVRQRVGALLREAGADYIIDTVADLPALLDSPEFMEWHPIQPCVRLRSANQTYNAL